MRMLHFLGHCFVVLLVKPYLCNFGFVKSQSHCWELMSLKRIQYNNRQWALQRFHSVSPLWGNYCGNAVSFSFSFPDLFLFLAAWWRRVGRRWQWRQRWSGTLALLVCSAVQPLSRECWGQLPMRSLCQVLQECQLLASAPVLSAQVAPAVPLRVLRQVVYDQMVPRPAHPECSPEWVQETVRASSTQLMNSGEAVWTSYTWHWL